MREMASRPSGPPGCPVLASFHVILGQNPQQTSQLTRLLGIIAHVRGLTVGQNAQQTGQLTGLLGIMTDLSQLTLG